MVITLLGFLSACRYDESLAAANGLVKPDNLALSAMVEYGAIMH